MSNLTDKKIRTLKPGKHGDGRGLSLLVRDTGKSWQFRFFWDGKEQTMSLGKWPDVPVELARERLQAARTKVAQGIHPTAEKRAIKEAIKAETIGTLQALSSAWLDRFYPKQDQNRGRIEGTLTKYFYPTLGDLPVSRIDSPMLAACLDQLVATGKIETAHRIVRALTKIWRWAIGRGFAKRNILDDLEGDLPAHVAEKFPGLTVPDAVGDLLLDIERYSPRIAQVKICMQLMPYFAQRPSELREATWSEFDLKAGLWRIPATRMKMRKKGGQPHVVPIPKQAVELLRSLSLLAPRAEVPDQIEAQILELRAQGFGKNKIARLVGVGEGTVQKLLRDSPPLSRADGAKHEPLPLDYRNVTHINELRKPIGYLFPSRETRNEIDSNQPFSDVTVNKALRSMGYCTLKGCQCGKRHHTGHGWRTTFSTLSSEELDASFVVKEKQLSHVTAGVAGVYDESIDLKARTKLMQEWADYLDKLREESRERRFPKELDLM